MKIAVDALPFVTGFGETYIVNLVRALAQIDRENEYLLIIPRDKGSWFPVLPNNFTRFVCPLPVNISSYRVGYRVAWEYLAMPRLLKEQGVNVLMVAGIGGVLRASCRVVFSLLITPHWFTEKSFKKTLRMRILEILMRGSVKRANHVITLSQVAREDLVNFTGIPWEKVTPIYAGTPKDILGLSQAQTSLTHVKHKYKIEGKYILFVSDLNRHKNHVRLIEAFARINGETDHHLVIAGGAIDKRYYAEILRAIDGLNLKEKVVLCGSVSKEDIPLLYKGADLYVCPSYLEAYGATTLEAMTYGCPVVASNIPVVREFCGDSILTFDPFNVDEMASTMHDLLFDDGLRKVLRDKGLERVELYSWDETARDTLAILQAVGQERIA